MAAFSAIIDMLACIRSSTLTKVILLQGSTLIFFWEKRLPPVSVR